MGIESEAAGGARISGVLEAHFHQPTGGSGPGADYAIGLKRGAETCSTIVRVYLAEDLTPAARSDTLYQGQAVLNYVFDRIAAGWQPSTGDALPPVTILNPDPGYAHPPKPGLLTRLFGRR